MRNINDPLPVEGMEEEEFKLEMQRRTAKLDRKIAPTGTMKGLLRQQREQEQNCKSNAKKHNNNKPFKAIG